MKEVEDMKYQSGNIPGIQTLDEYAIRLWASFPSAEQKLVSGVIVGINAKLKGLVPDPPHITPPDKPKGVNHDEY